MDGRQRGRDALQLREMSEIKALISWAAIRADNR
jgi:hypothetical protein